ncbi:MAG: chemotaxis protein CheV [Nitrospinae bacterium]|nr:chemotaxis protein CheV [Nitrospinota bacterium]MBI3815408.1 chemotaxis protein CheV [Nitrospinota bacterium]
MNLFGGELLLETGTNEIQLVEFTLRGQSFGVNVDKIQQIIEKPVVTDIPKTSGMICGIFDFRGQSIPLINLRVCLKFRGAGEDKAPKNQKVVVMEFNRVLNGFLVDDVKRLHRLSWTEIEPPKLALGKGYESYTVGMIKFNDRICTLIDFEKIVAKLNPDVSIKHTPKMPFKKERANIKILFAEDSQFVRNDVTKILRDAGFKVEAVTNGRDALNILERCAEECKKNKDSIKKFFNLVITDIEMPQMDGRHLTKRIKEHPVLKDLPVILFTSMSGMWSEVKAKTIGAEGLISKPEISDVVGRLEELVFSKRRI